MGADLTIVGAGFTGLSAAVIAKEERPEREVVLLDAATAGWARAAATAAVDTSLTHGLPTEPPLRLPGSRRSRSWGGRTSKG